ncbi:LysR family transcriptional regulator [Shewanella dokdonensis]|uniref:LysR family transcriptional regulator n=1 Tax=Shewanella dokdonensis TaxID=712036 RepID=A0ABX8DI94_9GAMM|nr:LysR family transcriptional regulator [Shewanella dokdonensis]MCL1076337.1 LysR family transcriptional regulator [Shewanella dokdonensis]QVK24509.1 LysR family transcriptional regulator [Shewanella dokdonensis]
MERLDCDRMFVAVMEVGSFSGAAARMGTSSGQASKLISRLEQELGVQLFKRSTRALAATDVGQAYYQRIKSLLEEYDTLDASVRNIATNPSGKLTISVPVTFGATQLTRRLIEFAQKYPQIELDVRYADRLVDLVEEGFDLALRIGKLDDSSLIARRLTDISVITVAAPGYLAIKGTPQHWQQLAEHDCIIDSNFRDPLHWRFMDEQQQLQLLRVHGRFSFSNTEVCLQAACAGLGVTQLPSFVATAALRHGDVVPLLSAYDMPPLQLYAVYPPAKHLALKSRVLIDFLLQTFSGKPKWD